MATRPSFDQIRAMLAQSKDEETGEDAGSQPGLGQTPPIPPAPGSIRETGLNETFLENLMLKTLFRRGQITLGQLCVELHLPYSGVVEDLYLALRREMLLEVKGGSDLASLGLRIALTNEGTSRAKTVLEREGYVGPAPVPLEAYKQQIANQPVKWSQVTDESMRQALGDVVVSAATLEKLGPAFNSGRSMFLFGNPGNGKTLISERMARALSLLYRRDIGGSLRARIVFRVDGTDGGEWYVDISPDSQTSGEGVVDHPNLLIHLRNTSVFCQMPTSRLNLPLALIRGDMKLRGDLRLFLRMDTLFSVDARP